MKFLDFQYMPVLRYREQERIAYGNSNFDSRITPLFEVITEKQRSTDTIDKLIRETSGKDNVIIDIPIYVPIKPNTQPSVTSFLNPMKANDSLRTQFFLDQRLVNQGTFIPTVSYDPQVPFSSSKIKEQIQELRKKYTTLAFRCHYKHNSPFLSLVESYSNEGDILIFDLDEANYRHSKFEEVHKRVTSTSQKKGLKSVLLRSTIPKDLTNTELENDEIVDKIDNSHLKKYSEYNYSAFGDYAGVKKDELTKGGVISPGYLFYSWESNSFYGYKGNFKSANSFTTILLPEILKSKPWKEFTDSHKNSCYGCSSITAIDQGTKKGNSQPSWKGFAASHYLKTLEEFLK